MLSIGFVVKARPFGTCDESNILALAARRSLRDLASSALGRPIIDAFRVVPQQDRSMESVERMLAALERLIRCARNIDELTLEAVAAEAHVTRQAAYRYFHDIKDLIRLFTRRIQTVEHELLLAALTEQRFETQAHLADTAVSFVIRAFEQISAVPLRMRTQFMRNYGEISYDLVWTMAEIVSATMSERDDPCAGTGAAALNCALVSIISVALSFCLKSDRLVASPTSRAIMLDLFLAATGGMRSAKCRDGREAASRRGKEPASPPGHGSG
jgi:AcrR family transcriptional regulator